MRILKSKKKGFYKAESSSRKGKFYEVDLKKPFCNCPQYMFRGIKTKTDCKHIIAVREFVQKKKAKKATQTALKTGAVKKGENIYKKTIEFVKKNKEVNSVKLIEKFGEEIVDELIRRGELIEYKGKVRVLS